MSISVLGLSYKTSPIGIRERIAFGADIVVAALRDLLQQPGVTEGVILSTCNRTEIYCNLDNSGSISLADWLWKFQYDYR
ncbi:hypothetical protein TI04_08015 [Achromatium sp. WMS2]|nr:hypothetical protein TI04_08015 [Achromatium sp. WMS2]